MSEDYWQDLVGRLDYAFQPIIDLESQRCFGYEALLRNVDQAGFASIQALMNLLYGENLLQRVNRMLIEKAIAKFLKLRERHEDPSPLLFFNLDSRILTDMKPLVRVLDEIYEKHAVSRPFICFEITEFFDVFRKQMDETGLTSRDRFSLAIDDFGTGFSDLKLLYTLRPDYIKIDRFFISHIDRDPDRKMFLRRIIGLCEALGAKVVAEGIESAGELEICGEVGFELVQGYFIQRPVTRISKLFSKPSRGLG